MSLLVILLTVAVSTIKLGQGFGIDLKHLVTHANRWQVIRGVLAAVIFVPILFLILIFIFQPTIAITLAIIIMGVAPAADLSANQVKILGGDAKLAGSVLLIASLISIVTTPLLLKFFEMILGLHIETSFVHIIKQVAIGQFIPMALSIILQKIFPQVVKFSKYIIHSASILLIVCFILIIIQEHAAFGEFKLNAYVALIVTSIGAFVLGVIFAGSDAKRQIALAIGSGLRNQGLAFLIATENFAKEKVNLAIVPYVTTTIVTVVLCTLLLKVAQRIRYV